MTFNIFKKDIEFKKPLEVFLALGHQIFLYRNDLVFVINFLAD